MSSDTPERDRRPTGDDAGRETVSETADSSDASGDPVLAAESLRKHFDQSDGIVDRLLGAGGTVRAVDGVDLTVWEGETLAVVGESGCGKSTLGKTLLNLETPTDGTIRYRGEDVTGLDDRSMRPYRRKLQMVFQDPLASLNPRQTVGEIVTAPMAVHDIGDSAADRRRRAEELLDRVGLEPEHTSRYPGQFSGGQQQRVGIARALSVDPELIVADEPVSALDVSVQAQILNLLQELQADLGLSILFVTHDLSVVRQVADRVAVMYLGEIVETAPVEELFSTPRHPYTKSLLSAVPRIDPSARTDRVVLRGTVPSPIDPPDGCRFHTRCPEVIPGDDWPGDQASFRRAFTFRVRIEEGELEPDAVRERLAADGDAADDSAVGDRLAETAVPGSLDDLPRAARSTIRDAAVAVAAGDRRKALELARGLCPSPCVDDAPTTVDYGEDETAACHRVDPSRPADPSD
ncbi:ABC transporter ATP-binding protein [Halobaculum sp. MBLA0143]|uniref:ABC transporter ATP-binding protein n=1 Tax=Halobaculum sp. MBLA0143 TaxID=3079933 RepID=UPI003526663C